MAELLVMYDSIELANLVPVAAQADLLAGYDDGNWPDADSIAAYFPDKRVVRVTTNPADNEGDVLDVELGDASPSDLPGWLARRRAAGAPWATCYCSEATWSQCRAAVAGYGMTEPPWWIAAMPGPGAALIAGAVAHQYADAGSYDVSAVNPAWPLLSPPFPPPSPPSTYPGEHMVKVPFNVTVSGGAGWWPIPSSYSAANLVSVVMYETDPDATGRYADVPVPAGKASQPGPQAPNGAVVFKGGADGTFGGEAWFVTG